MLGDSKQGALKRFHNLERKLQGDNNLREQYTAFMTEYKALEPMRLVTNSEVSKVEYFLPHHAVIKESSLTTKLRVVFDGSAKTNTGLSTNDLLSVGPPVQDDLISILIRFRTHKYALTADISKMYRQILIDPNQYKRQRIFWRENMYQPIQMYDLVTVMYSTSCAPYLATKCLNHLAAIEKTNFPVGSRVLRQDFYVDDLLSGANTREEALVIRNELIALLDRAAFQLRKWVSNDPSLLVDLNNTNHTNQEPNSTENLKTLGVY